MITRIIGSFIVLLVGFSLIGPISEQVNKAAMSSNVTISKEQSILMNSIPLVFALTILTVVIIIVYYSFRNSGLLNGREDYEDEEEPEELEQQQNIKTEPRKQTYLDYVKERKMVEKLIHGRWF